MTNLTETLKAATTDFKESYLGYISNWADKEYDALRAFVADYNANYDATKERKYFSLPACVVNAKGKKSDYIDIQLKKADNHFNNSIEKLAARVEKKGLNVDAIKVKSRYLDPNLAATITDGVKTVTAYTIIASGCVQKPHYRYLIK